MLLQLSTSSLMCTATLVPAFSQLQSQPLDPLFIALSPPTLIDCATLLVECRRRCSSRSRWCNQYPFSPCNRAGAFNWAKWASLLLAYWLSSQHRSPLIRPQLSTAWERREEKFSKLSRFLLSRGSSHARVFNTRAWFFLPPFFFKDFSTVRETRQLRPPLSAASTAYCCYTCQTFTPARSNKELPAESLSSCMKNFWQVPNERGGHQNREKLSHLAENSKYTFPQIKLMFDFDRIQRACQSSADICGV